MNVQAHPKTDLIKLCQIKNNHAEKLMISSRINQRKAKLLAEKKRRQNEIVSLCVLIAVGILLCLFLIFGKTNVSACTQMNQNYTITGELQGNCVVLENGEVREVEETNYTSESITVHCLMDDNGTPKDKTDDKVINTY